jgi:hypothetical protein
LISESQPTRVARTGRAPPDQTLCVRHIGSEMRFRGDAGKLNMVAIPKVAQGTYRWFRIAALRLIRVEWYSYG